MKLFCYVNPNHWYWTSAQCIMYFLPLGSKQPSMSRCGMEIIKSTIEDRSKMVGMKNIEKPRPFKICLFGNKYIYRMLFVMYTILQTI